MAKPSLLLFTAALLFFSCDKEEVPEFTKSDLLGGWQIESSTSKFGESEVTNECGLKSNLIFYKETIEQNWYIAGFNGSNCHYIEINHAYSLEGNQLIMTPKTETDVVFYGTIMSPTEIDIVLESDEGKIIQTYRKS